MSIENVYSKKLYGRPLPVWQLTWLKVGGGGGPGGGGGGIGILLFLQVW